MFFAIIRKRQCLIKELFLFSDYIRTFTWDKKIEMVVKSTYSHIGGQGKITTGDILYRFGSNITATRCYSLKAPANIFTGPANYILSCTRTLNGPLRVWPDDVSQELNVVFFTNMYFE